MTAALSDLMTDYYAAREAQEIRLEAATMTRDHAHEEADRFFQRPGSAGQGERPVTFKAWLKHARPGDPDAETVRDVCRTLAWDAHQKALEAQAAYELAVSVRDMALADASEAGLSYRDLGATLGVSQTVVGKCVLRHQQARTGQAG